MDRVRQVMLKARMFESPSGYLLLEPRMPDGSYAENIVHHPGAWVSWSPVGGKNSSPLGYVALTSADPDCPMKRVCLLIQMDTSLLVSFIDGEADPVLKEVLTLPRGGEAILMRTLDTMTNELTPEEIRGLIERSGF